MALDREYYFRTDPQGRLSNWSGCGNDVRAEAPLFQRLVRESLTHWTEVLGVDGVRLDLAELLGTSLLREIEADFRARAAQDSHRRTLEFPRARGPRSRWLQLDQLG